MTQLIQTSEAILDQLSMAIKQMTDAEFVHPSVTLSGSSVAQHLRHTLEFFICLEQGYDRGVINYDKRAHDKMIESNKIFALEVIERIHSFVKKQTSDKELTLEANYSPGSEEIVAVNTSYFRELTYNIEHAVHHMAIIKIGIKEVASNVELPADFGVAASTMRYREQALAALI
jgi:hypothetical protein